MADKYDPYREALVVETSTVWPEDFELDPERQYQLSATLHAHPEEVEKLEYVRVHTGFCRTIHVTDVDIERASALVG